MTFSCCFFLLFFFAPCHLLFLDCSVKISQTKIMKTVNPHLISERRRNSLICWQQSVLTGCFFKTGNSFWRLQLKLSWFARVLKLFLFPRETLWSGHCRASLPFGLSHTTGQPSMLSKWEHFQAECEELMSYDLVKKKRKKEKITDSFHDCFSTCGASQQTSARRMLVIRVCSRNCL